MIFFNFVALFAIGAIASPTPFLQEIEVLEPRQDAGAKQNVTVDQCSFFSPDGILPECWEVLEMNNHLNYWWSNHSAKCEAQNKGFAQCYLDNAGLITWQCDFVALNACTPPPSGKDAGYASYHDFYVIWNIYAINLFWTNYHQSLLQGQAAAIGSVAEIVKTVAPPTTKHPKTPLFAPIYAVSIGQFAALAPLLGNYLGASMIFASLLGVLGGGAGLFNVLFPTKQQYDVPWEGLSDALGVHVNDFQKQVGEALTQIQTNFTTFYALVNNGGFSQRLNTNVPENTDFMYHSLKKWVFNQALQQAGYFAVKNPAVDPTQIPIGPYDCSKLNDKGTCGPLWHDGKDTYGLAKANDIGMDRMQEILDTAFSKNWTTPAELYIDAQSCRGKNGTESFDINDLHLSCVSNLPVCEFNFDYNPYETLWARVNPPMFTNCPNMRGYGVPPYWSDDVGIPLTYVGPFLMAKVIYNEKSG